VLVAALLIVPLLAGCLGNDDSEPTPPANKGNMDAILASIASSALTDSVETIREADRVTLNYGDFNLPADISFPVPEGATMVRFVADPGDSNTVAVSMSHSDTGRRRCNQQTVQDFAGAFLGARSCSSIALIDNPGTVWNARASGTGSASIQVEFYASAIDGAAGQVDWSLLSKADHELLPTDGFYITAHDGAQLWVEVTLPDGPGPWPTVIAASPYNGQAGRIADPGTGEGGEGTPAMWTYWTQDYAKRGYAAVNIDVRGFGKSGGCVEVWGANEQADQKLIVDWVADQAWSDGSVGFYGQSYVATTPVAAAVQAPEALKAIIAVAPVIDSYFDWHYGGVPNGESSLSPVAYQVLTDMMGANWILEDPTHATDVATLLQYSTQGICDPTLVPLANDPRAIHGDFFDTRDFGARAGDVTAAVLYTQGFEDANVKGAMIPDWFNDIEAPKLGVFGHWLHQHPSRMDAEALFLGWMDEFVKGKPLGIAEAYPNALISANEDTHRESNVWPPIGEPIALGANFDAGTLGDGAGSVQLDMTPLPNPQGTTIGPIGSQSVTLTGPASMEPLPLVAPELRLHGSLTGPDAFVYASLTAIYADGSREFLTEGMRNLALSDDYNAWTPLAPTDTLDVILPFRPTELLLPTGTALELTIRGVQAGEALGTAQPLPGLLTLDGETELLLHDVPLESFHHIPLTALP
ncbi:MAG: CocE/NonD family hydrolase, partial [Thermoplasmatota archaeon]